LADYVIEAGATLNTAAFRVIHIVYVSKLISFGFVLDETQQEYSCFNVGK